MKIINKIFAKEDNKYILSALLGPVFLFLSLCVFNFRFAQYSLELWLIVFLGIMMCWLLRKEGFYATLCMLILTAVFKHYQLQSHLWLLGIEASLALGFAITTLGFEDLYEMLQYHEDKQNDLLQNLFTIEKQMLKDEKLYQEKIQFLEENIDEINLSLQQKEEQVLSFASLIEALRKNENQNFSDRDIFKNTILEKEKQNVVLQEKIHGFEEKISHLSDHKKLDTENIELLQELNDARTQMYQNHYINEALALELAKQDIKQDKPSQQLLLELEKKQNLIQEYEKILQENKNIATLYQQLKLQFQEKKHILHQARSAAFHMHEKILATQKDQDMAYYEDCEEKRQLFNDIDIMIEEMLLYEKEIQKLQHIILSLTTKPSQQKPIQPDLPL